MPRLRTETYGSGDRSWLASDHGTPNAITGTIDISAFTAATHYADGYIKSGTPVAKVSGLLVPYTVAEGTTTGAGILYGFLMNDEAVVPASGVGAVDFPAAVIRHGHIVVAKVPYASFAAPAAAAKKADSNFIYE